MNETSEDLVYRTSRWQRLLYETELEAQNGLQKVAEKGKHRAPRFNDYQRELFARFYNPRTPKLDETAEGGEWAAELHRLAEEVAEFKVLQNRTKGDEMWSGMATATVNNSVVAKMKTQQDNGTNEDLDKLQRRIESLIDMGKKGVDVTDRIAKAEKKLERAKAQAEAMAKGLDPAQIRNAIRKGCEKAQDKINKREEAISAFTYGNQPGSPMSLRNMDEKRALAKRIESNNKLQRIAALAGRLRLVAAEKQRSKSNYARDEVQSIEQGADLERLLPSELAFLGSGNPALETLFYARLAERKAMQYRLTGRETQGRGPVVMCLDESGSMAGDSEVWCKAVALALLDICQRQKRSWVLIHFDERVSRVDVVHSGEVKAEELMQAMLHFTGGGTNFAHPLDKAIEVIESEGGFRKADILLVTDGCCNTTTEWNEGFKAKKKELDINVMTVLVGPYAHAVSQWSDATFRLHEILNDGPQQGAFEDKAFTI